MSVSSTAPLAVLALALLGAASPGFSQAPVPAEPLRLGSVYRNLEAWSPMLRAASASARAAGARIGPVSRLPDPTLQPDAEIAARSDLERALATLPPLTRSVVWLHDVEGYTHGEIAAMLGGTPSFSKSQLARAHARLRELLDGPNESLTCTHVSNIC